MIAEEAGGLCLAVKHNLNTKCKITSEQLQVEGCVYKQRNWLMGHGTFILSRKRRLSSDLLSETGLGQNSNGLRNHL